MYQPSNNGNRVVAAIEDGLVNGGIVFFTMLASGPIIGQAPLALILWSPLMASALTFLMSYAKRRGITRSG